MQTLRSTDSERAGRSDTIVSRFLTRASHSPEREAYTVHPTGAFQSLGTLRWGDWAAQARAVAGALIADHVQPGERLVVFANNRLLWPIAEMGAAMAGVVTVGVDASAGTDVVAAQLEDCNASVVVVDTLARLKMVRAIQTEYMKPFTVVCDDLEPMRSNSAERLFAWDTWCDNGATALESYALLRAELSRRVDAIVANAACTIFYGASSARGIVFTHHGLLHVTQALVTQLNMVDTDVVVCAEQIAQPFGRLLGLNSVIVSGCSASLMEDASSTLSVARELQPTIIAGGIRVMVKLNEAANAATVARDTITSPFQNTISHRIRVVLLPGDDLVDDHLVQLLRDSRMPMSRVFGTPQHLLMCRSTTAEARDGSVGRAAPGTELRVAEHGELLVRRDNCTFKEFWQRDDETHAAFTGDGQWLCSGYIASVDSHGCYYLEGRSDDLITLASGLRVAVPAIEQALAETPFIQYAACLGQSREYLVAILSLRRNVVEAWAHSRGVVAPWGALVQTPMVRHELALAVARVNEQRLPHEHVRNFAVTDTEFSAHEGELTMANKVVRQVVETRFRHVLNELYTQ